MAGPSAVVFAYHGFGSVGLEALVRAGVAIRRVFTHADAPGEHIWWRSVAGWAAERGIPVVLDGDLADPQMQALIAEDRPDFLFSFYYRKMIPEAVLNLVPRGCFNLHGSLLPKFRGRAPVNWQLVQGVSESGLTLHRMVRKADAGDIIAQEAVAVHPDQDALGLTRQLLALAPVVLSRAISGIVAGTADGMAQDQAQATYFGGRKPADGAIDWRWPARRVHNLVRAVAPPWPGAFTWLPDGRQILVWRTAVAVEMGTLAPPGTILAGDRIACGEGAVTLLTWSLTDQTPVALISGSHLMNTPL
jgi:UDP-4-amino-4-deoxy-L-arabinose formyltransferase / UDP-glucuronic acid dehydrogenase (UDP-4-keto-hexauronic acid decarboxylating)